MIDEGNVGSNGMISEFFESESDGRFDLVVIGDVFELVLSLFDDTELQRGVEIVNELHPLHQYRLHPQLIGRERRGGAD